MRKKIANQCREDYFCAFHHLYKLLNLPSPHDTDFHGDEKGIF